MSDLILEPTTTAQWQRLIREAASSSAHQLDEDLESYLVFVLMRFCRDPALTKRIMAIEFLQSLHAQGQLRNAGLRDVGDQCLLFAGIFPHLARRRMVKISYFVDLGRSAYHELSEFMSVSAAELYRELSAAFVSLMEVLHHMCELRGDPLLQPLEAMELWRDTGSTHARDTLRATTEAPVIWTSTAQRTH